MSIKKGIEVVTIADVPGKGTGLGSSSSLDVGLLNALNHYIDQPFHNSPMRLAEDACKIEIDVLQQPIGKQDQFIAAFGGLNYIRFNSDGTVKVHHIRLSNINKNRLEQNLMCFYTGITRKSSDILTVQKRNIPNRLEILDELRGLAGMLWWYLKHNNLTHFGQILHQNWELKKQLAGGITNSAIDALYEKALKAGAEGGKISGAGGGGFLTLYCEKHKQKKVREALKDLTELEVKLEPEGSKVVYAG